MAYHQVVGSTKMSLSPWPQSDTPPHYQLLHPPETSVGRDTSTAPDFVFRKFSYPHPRYSFLFLRWYFLYGSCGTLPSGMFVIRFQKWLHLRSGPTHDVVLSSLRERQIAISFAFALWRGYLGMLDIVAFVVHHVRRLLPTSCEHPANRQSARDLSCTKYIVGWQMKLQ